MTLEAMMPAYSGGNRWVGIISGRSPDPPPTLTELGRKRPRMAQRKLRTDLKLDQAPVGPAVTINPHPVLSVHDLSQVLREVGRAYHFMGKDREAAVCKSLVKQLLHGSPPGEQLPRWLCQVISRGFAQVP